MGGWEGEEEEKKDSTYSLPVSMIRRHSGMISVWRRKEMTSESSILTRAPITPRLVRRRYSKGRLLLMTVLRNGYRYMGMCAVCLGNGGFGWVGGLVG